MSDLVKKPKAVYFNGFNKRADRHAKARAATSLSAVAYWATIVFFFLPLLVLLVTSFDAERGGEWSGFSTVWYQKLFLESGELWHAFGNSVIIALASALTATALGTLAAIGATWYRFPLRGYVRTLNFLPMILPEIIIGVSLLVFFAGVGFKLGLVTIYIAHATFNLPFVFLMVSARLEEFDYSVIEAARDLGANERQTLIKIIVPMAMPGIVSGFLTAVTLSLEDFVITFFVTGPGSTTLPLYVYSAIRFGVSPVINALSVVMVAGTVALIFPLRNFLKYIAAK